MGVGYESPRISGVLSIDCAMDDGRCIYSWLLSILKDNIIILIIENDTAMKWLPIGIILLTVIW